MVKFTLYSYWRSSCSWRVRTALILKGFEYEYKTISLIDKGPGKGTFDEEFRRLNPYAQIPVLVIEENGKEISLSQSLAIIQYLEEKYPETRRLLPADPLERAKVRIVSDCIAAGIQPLQNVTILEKLNDVEKGLGLKFANKMISDRFADLEVILKDYSGKYCVGDEVTMADLCLAPQVYNAIRYEVDVSKFPIISRINDELLKLEAFAKGHPAKQPDAPAP